MLTSTPSIGLATTTTAVPTRAPASHRAHAEPPAVHRLDRRQIETPRPTRTTVGFTTSMGTMPTTASRHALIQGATPCSNNSSNRETDAGGAGDFLGHPPYEQTRGSPSCNRLRLEEEVARRWRSLCLSHTPIIISTHRGSRRNPSSGGQRHGHTMLRYAVRGRQPRFTNLSTRFYCG